MIHGIVALPKSVTPSRIEANYDVFGFELSDDEMARIDALETGVRGGPVPDEARDAFYQLEIPEA